MPLCYQGAVALLACFLAPLWTSAALAQGQAGKWHWQKVVTTGGCVFYRWVPVSLGDPYAIYSYEWSGQCTAQKFATGQGTLHVRVKPGREITVADRMNVGSTWTGTFRDGLLEGSFRNCSEGYKQQGIPDGCMTRTFDRSCQPADIKKSGCVPGSAPTGQPSGGGWKTAQAAGGKDKKAAAARGGSTKGCLSLIDEPGSYGGFKNSCDHDIELTYCIANFVVTQGGFNWGDAFACEKGKFGRVSVKAKGRSGNHTKGGRVYYFACKAPMGPIDVAYEKGRGLVGNCK